MVLNRDLHATCLDIPAKSTQSQRMTARSEDVALELEALQATYGDELVIAEQTVSMLLEPTVDMPADAYVQCQLVLGIAGTGYPEDSPSIQLQDVKGFSSSRLAALKDHLQQEANSMLGEMMLGHLFESARDWLTEHNQPDGSCIFCLEDLYPARGDDASQQTATTTAAAQQPLQYVKLPCYHVFHLSCFINWWVWKQQSLMQQQQQLEHRTGATAAAALAQDQLPPKEAGHFQLSCPSCRNPFSLQEDLQHLEQKLVKQLQQQQRQQPAGSGESSPSSSTMVDGKLTAAQLAPFRQIQQRHASLYAAQQMRDGIITTVSHSIADWDAAAAAAVAARQNSGGGDSSRAVDQSHRDKRGSRGPQPRLGNERQHHQQQQHKQLHQQQDRRLQAFQEGHPAQHRVMAQCNSHSGAKSHADAPLQKTLRSKVIEHDVQQQQQQHQCCSSRQNTVRSGSTTSSNASSGSGASRRGRGRGRVPHAAGAS